LIQELEETLSRHVGTRAARDFARRQRASGVLEQAHDLVAGSKGAGHFSGRS
jgi:hypothetical protein